MHDILYLETASHMIKTPGIELAAGRALATAYPWLMKVQRLPGAGLIGAPGWWHGFDAANDSTIDPAPG